MFRINIRHLCGRCIQMRNFSLAHPLCAKSVSVERPSEQLHGTGASSTKGAKSEVIDDVRWPSDKPIETDQVVRGSIAQRLYMNDVDIELLAFPEVVEKVNLDAIKNANKTKTPYFRQPLSIVDKNSAVFNNLSKMDIFKHNIQTEYGGLGYTTTELALASEPEGNNVSVAMALNAHRNVCSAISEFGSIRQKEKYLPLLASGELMGTVGMYERQADADNASFSTKAELHGDVEFVLNGSKAYVMNSVNAQLMLVFAQTRTPDMLGDMNDSISAFLVETNLPGVTICKRDETIGSQDVYQSTVEFKNVRVKAENWLSTPGNGQIILQKQITQKRLQHGVINIMQMKNILEHLLLLCKYTEDRIPLRNAENAGVFEAVSLRDAIARTVNAIYASESIVYLTTGIADIYKNANIELESAIVKLYTQEKLLSIMGRATEFSDSIVTIKGHPMAENIRNAIQLQTYDDPNDALKLYTAICGIQYCGRAMFDDVIKKRNPLFNPEYIMKSLMQRHQTIEDAELKLNIINHLHPAFDFSSKWFEQSVARLQMGTRILMIDYARDLPQQHCKILRLANAGILCYVSMAVLSRASRSMCHKFETASMEHSIAGLVCKENSSIVLDLMQQIEIGPSHSFDTYYQKVAKMVIKEKKYFAEHPLTRFF